MIKSICSYIILAFSLITTLAFLINKNVRKGVKILELIGQIFIIVFLILQIYGFEYVGEIILILAATMIMIACVLNGKYTFGRINLSHHIFRGIIFAVNIFLIIKN